MGSIIGHRIDYNGVGALRGQRHIPSKNWPKWPPPPPPPPTDCVWTCIWVCTKCAHRLCLNRHSVEFVLRVSTAFAWTCIWICVTCELAFESVFRVNIACVFTCIWVCVTCEHRLCLNLHLSLCSVWTSLVFELAFESVLRANTACVCTCIWVCVCVARMNQPWRLGHNARNNIHCNDV